MFVCLLWRIKVCIFVFTYQISHRQIANQIWNLSHKPNVYSLCTLLHLSTLNNFCCYGTQVSENLFKTFNLVLHPFGVAKSSTSFGWGKGGKVTAARWEVTLCDSIWHAVILVSNSLTYSRRNKNLSNTDLPTMLPRNSLYVKKVKYSNTCYRAMSPELIPVYRQSTRRWLFKSSSGSRLPLLSRQRTSPFFDWYQVIQLGDRGT